MTRLLLSLLLLAQPAAAQFRAAAVRAPSSALPTAAGPRAAGLPGLSASVLASPALPANGVLPSAPAASAQASLSAQVVAKVLAEDPAAKAELVASFEAAPFRAALGDVGRPEDYLAGRLGDAFIPYFETYAAEVGHRDAEAGMRFLLSEEPSAVETRRGLGRLLRSGSARSESWTYIFRDSALWQKHLEEYLDGRVAAKKARGERSLSVQSVGAAYGAEPYTLAILTEAALKRAGEDPKAWDVRIAAADMSLMSLISAREGFYKDPDGGGYYIPKYAGEALRREHAEGRLLPAGAGLYRLREDLRPWVQPFYIDLNDVRQHRALTRTEPDVVFANYVLTHLRLAPAVRLAEHWLSGLWSDHGFLAMAQTLVAEASSAGGLSAKGKVGHLGSFLRGVSLTVGAIGGAYGGDSAEPWHRLRDMLFTARTPTAKRVRAAAARYHSALWRDPFHAEDLDGEALAALERVASETGARVELTADRSVVVGMTRDEAVAVSVGLLMGGEADRAKRVALMERLVRAYAAKAQKGAAAPRDFTDPRYGAGSVALEGTAAEGARLKAVRFEDGARLLWLVPGRLAPITDAYVD
ncbi:hypothetical protein EPO15_17745, partial [bacterium]